MRSCCGLLILLEDSEGLERGPLAIQFQFPRPIIWSGEKLSLSESDSRMAAALRKIVGRNLISSTGNRTQFIIPPALFISCRGIASKLFVGGLSFCTTDEGLSETFSQYGQVIEAKVIRDRVSDRSKGFGFVTFASLEEAKIALTEMNGKTLNGRVIFVDYAKPKPNFGGGGMAIARGPPEPSDRVSEDYFNPS